MCSFLSFLTVCCVGLSSSLQITGNLLMRFSKSESDDPPPSAERRQKYLPNDLAREFLSFMPDYDKLAWYLACDPNGPQKLSSRKLTQEESLKYLTDSEFYRVVSSCVQDPVSNVHLHEDFMREELDLARYRALRKEIIIHELTPGFANLANTLKSLNLTGQEISDISALVVLRNLEVLNLNFTRVFDLKPLRGLVNLKDLWLRNTLISDLTPLYDLKELKRIFLADTNFSLESLEPLARLLPKLEYISMGYKPHALEFIREAINKREGVLGQIRLVNDEVLNEKPHEFYLNRQDLLIGFLPGFEVYWTRMSDIHLRPIRHSR